MSSELKTYSTPKALLDAVRAKSVNASIRNPAIFQQEWISDRFLCRVFSVQNDNTWALKGGTAILARIPNARATTDLDLTRSITDLNTAIDELIALSRIDLDDFLNFQYKRRQAILEGDRKPHLEGARLHFSVEHGGVSMPDLTIDITVSDLHPGKLETLIPASRIQIESIPQFAYSLYPLANQIADKVCATYELYSGKPSTRTKDIIDLVLIANSQSVSKKALKSALELESEVRRLSLSYPFAPSEHQMANYSRQSKKVFKDSQMIETAFALDLLNRFLDLNNSKPLTAEWNPKTRTWN